MTTVEKVKAVVARLLHSQGHRDTTKNQKALIKRYLDLKEHEIETADERLLWNFLHTSESI